MDKKVIKKIAAKEGLILILVLIISYIIYKNALEISDLYIKIRYSHIPKDTEWGSTLLFHLHNFAYRKIEVFSYFIYPIYLLIRFVLWAIRTVKEK